MGEDAIYYKDGSELLFILTNLDKKEINDLEWGKYCEDYTAEKVMNEFNEVYLK